MLMYSESLIFLMKFDTFYDFNILIYNNKMICMKSYEKSELIDDQITSLQDELQELLEKAESLLNYKSEDINQIIEDLLSLNSDESIAIATDIMDIEEDMIITEEYYSETELLDDPFINLYDEDSE